MNMDTKNSSPSENSQLIMIVAEERETLRTLFDDIEPDADGHRYIPPHEFQIMNLRSRYNPDLNYYKVDCESWVRYGMNADEIFELISDRYYETKCKPLDELFPSSIERI